MSLEFLKINSSLVDNQAAGEILKCNEYTVKFGLSLSESQVMELAETRSYALRENGRIEFGGGTINKLIMEFFDSTFIENSNYTQMLNELIEIFYYYKTQTMEKIGDTELIQYMRKCFDGECNGSLKLLYGKALDRIIRNLNNGLDIYYNEEEDGLVWEDYDE